MIAAIILAAGKSTRFGTCKQLLKWNDKTLIEHVIKNVKQSKVDGVIVVLGFMAEVISKKVTNCMIVINSNYDEGMSGSLKAGLRTLEPNIEASIFVLGDQPLITAQIINSLILKYQSNRAKIVIPVHHGKRGNPVLIDRILFQEIEKLDGDMGAREIIANNEQFIDEVIIDTPDIFRDIDTEEDYFNMMASLK